MTRSKSISRGARGADHDAQHRDDHEDDGEPDGELEEGLLQATPRSEDRRVVVERAAEAGTLALKQDDHHQDYGDDDLRDVDVGAQGFPRSGLKAQAHYLPSGIIARRAQEAILEAVPRGAEVDGAGRRADVRNVRPTRPTPRSSRSRREMAGSRSAPRAFVSRAYAPDLRSEILACCDPASGSVDRICRLGVRLGEALAAAALEVIATAGLAPADVDLVASARPDALPRHPAGRAASLDAPGRDARDYRRAHRHHHGRRLPAGRRRRGWPGRTAGPVCRLPPLRRRQGPARRAQYRRHRERHRLPGGRGAGRGLRLRHRTWKHGRRRARGSLSRRAARP